jgi:site-specific recombinase XerD
MLKRIWHAGIMLNRLQYGNQMIQGGRLAAVGLIPIDGTVNVSQLRDSVRGYVNQSRSKNTLRGYRADWQHFVAFSEVLAEEAMPARPENVAAYLSSCADHAPKAGSIQRRVSAIAAMYKAAGYDSPTLSPVVKLCLAGIRRALGTRQEGKKPTLTSDIAAMCSHLPPGLLGIRDRAILLIGFAGGFRRSELVGLNFGDLQFGDDGVRIMIAHSKTDQEGAGQVVGIARGMNLCPVAALQAWLSAASITYGPAFRSVTRHGHVEPDRLTDQVVAMVVKRYSAAAGLDPAKYSWHSLRAGLVTQAALNGVSEHAIMRQTRHKSTEMLRRYIRDANLFGDNASGRLGL